MKSLNTLIIFLFAMVTSATAQEVKRITFTSDGESVNIKSDSIDVMTYDSDDATNLNIGFMSVQISPKNKNDEYYSGGDEKFIKISMDRFEKRKFNGHWAGLQLGFNGFANTDYSMYEQMPRDVPAEFMDLKQGTSWEFNMNLLEYNVSFNKSQNFGLVTGMGFTWNNYKFSNSISIDKDENGNIIPFDLEENNYKKSKLVASYLTVPLLVEYQSKTKSKYVSLGVVGGLNLNSHTKIKNDGDKQKDKGSFSLNTFRASGQLQLGADCFSMYFRYSFTELFKADKGPELTPFSVGITLVNF